MQRSAAARDRPASRPPRWPAAVPRQRLPGRVRRAGRRNRPAVAAPIRPRPAPGPRRGWFPC